MKFTLLTSIVLLNFLNGISQALHPYSLSCLEPVVYMNPSAPVGTFSFSYTHSSNTCVEFYNPTPTGNLIREGITKVTAGNYIHIKDNMHINLTGAPDVDGPGSSTSPAEFHAYITPNDFDVFWFEPNTTVGEVPKYEKLELGVRLPLEIRDKIDNFVNNAPIGDKINPFNPDEISVEAEFQFLGGSIVPPGLLLHKTIYGFYYKEFHRVIDLDLDITDDYWQNDTSTFYFRIRHALAAVGDWRVTVKVHLSGETLEAAPIMLKCISSTNPGFIHTGVNKHYLKLGNETFFPVGNNIPHISCTPTSEECTNYEAYGPKTARPKQYEWMGLQLEKFKDNGGNFYRFLFNPWHIDIEFEKLNNYSDRLSTAWEMDRLLDKTKELNLFMHLNLQIHIPFENTGPYGFFFWDWGANTLFNLDPTAQTYIPPLPIDVGNCYNIELGLGDPKLFFTNEDAIKNYKRKLRYIISRWGYSTNIALMELFSEIDGACVSVPWKIVPKTPGEVMVGDPILLKLVPDQSINYTKPYWEDSEAGIDHAKAVNSWEKEMFDYIKDDLKHYEHLLGPSYTGGTGGPSKGERENKDSFDHNVSGPDIVNDDIYSYENVDFMGYSFYSTHIDRFVDAKDQINFRHFYNNKPFFFPEFGKGDGLDCDNGIEWLRGAWITPFLGCAGKGSHWDYFWNQKDYWKHFQYIKDFLDEYNFADEMWTPVYDNRNNSLDDLPDWWIDHLNVDSENQSEVYALVSENKNKCVGVIVNRTENFFTNNEGPDTYCGVVSNADAAGITADNETNSAENVDYDNFSHALKIDLEPGNYQVDFYNANGVYLSSDEENVFLGKINLEHPTLKNHAYTEKSYIMPFRAYKSSSFHSHTSITDTTIIEQERQYKVDLVPNPASDMVNITFDRIYGGQKLKIFTVNGQMILCSAIKEVKTTIDVRNFENGIYTAVLTFDSEVVTKKFIIQHAK